MCLNNFTNSKPLKHYISKESEVIQSHEINEKKEAAWKKRNNINKKPWADGKSIFENDSNKKIDPSQVKKKRYKQMR